MKVIEMIKLFIVFLSESLLSLPSRIARLIKDLRNHFVKIYYDLGNLKETNLKLGKYHLSRGNLSDAIFRFNLVERYFNKGNKEAHYNLGWCYFMQNKFSKSLEHLDAAKEEDMRLFSLSEFIRSMDQTDLIPEKIFLECRNLNVMQYVDKFLKKDTDIAVELSNEIIRYIDVLPDQYYVLEISSNFGFLGHQLRKRMPDEMTLVGIEESSELNMLKEVYFPDNDFYDMHFELSLDNFLKEQKHKYNIIVSVDGFGYTKNLESEFAKLHAILIDGGVFALAYMTSSSTYLDKKCFEFIHSDADIRGALIKNKLNVDIIRNIELTKNKYCSIVIAKKI